MRVDVAAELNGLDSAYHGCPPKKKKKTHEPTAVQENASVEDIEDVADDVSDVELPALCAEL